MKTLKHLFTALLLLCSITASARDFEVDGIYYNITRSTDKTVEVQGVTNGYTGSLVIPESVVYNDVTYSVTSIGGWVFNGRTDLTGELVIPNSVTSIGDNAFQDCSGLTSVVIGNSVTSIGSHAFVNCSGLISVEFNAENCTAMPDYYFAFQGCTALSTVTIGENVKNIPDNAFRDCSGLTSVEIPNSVTSIGESAFKGCSGLKEVHISDLGAWCQIYFGNYTANPLYYAHNLYLNGEVVSALEIPSGVTAIKDNAFAGGSCFTSVTIPSSVTSIGVYGFVDCGTLSEVNIPNNVTTIGDNAFWNGTGLKKVTIPNSVTRIGANAFHCVNAIFDIVSDTPATVASNAFHADAILVVPDASVDAYKAAWGGYANQIVARDHFF